MTDVIPDMDGLLKQLQEKKLPPVHQWNPDISSGIDIQIKRNGDWYYQGSLIQRPSMVRLFSKVLRRDGDSYFLVTPVEKLQVIVDDAPFTAISMDVLFDKDKQYLVFTNNVSDKTIAGKNNPIFINYYCESGQPSPYVEVRDGLNALIVRSVYFQLAEQCVVRAGYYCVWSDGQFFKLDKVEG